MLASGLGVLSGGLIRPPPVAAKEKIKVDKHHKYIKEEPRKVSIIEDVDVLVVGGGMAGVGAAVAAGRMGAKTLLIEYFGCLGGNGTSGMVNNFCGYSSSSPTFQIVKGIGDDVLANLYARGGNASRTSTTFNPEILKMVLDDMMAGRFVSCTHLAQASTRVMGPAVVMGQAVGTAAALSINERVTPRKLDVGLLQNELAAAGAFLG